MFACFVTFATLYMSNKFISWLIFVILCLIWGSSFKLMKDSTVALHPSQIAALRIFSAGFVFLPFAFFHFTKIPRRRMGVVILSAVVGNLLPAFLFATAMTKIDGSLGGILNSLTPLCVVIIGIFFFKDKIKKRKIAGVIIGFIGLTLLIIAPVLRGEKSISFNNLDYLILILAATLLYGLNVNMVSHFLKDLNPVHVATVSLSFMVIPTFFVLWQQNILSLDLRKADVQYAVLASTGLGIVGSAVATLLFYILVKKAGGLFASLVTYGIPFIALLWGLLDHEKITPLKIFSLFVILFGVYLVNKPEKKKPAPADAG